MGAFRQRINADQLAIRLRADGYRPVIRTAGEFLLVTVGSFPSRSGAERLAAQLRARRYDALVIP
ncbi:MAG TPA: SPOR domain-containing protein [bacterium]|nr:SPOR domain-containing protein [bacterium]